MEPMEHNNITALPEFRPAGGKSRLSTTTRRLHRAHGQDHRVEGVERPDGKYKISTASVRVPSGSGGIRVGIYHWWQQYTPATDKEVRARYVGQQRGYVFQRCGWRVLGDSPLYRCVCSLGNWPCTAGGGWDGSLLEQADTLSCT